MRAFREIDYVVDGTLEELKGIYLSIWKSFEMEVKDS
jgi:hypothetical protein